MGAAVARLWGWGWGSGIVFGLCLSVASTVVLQRALEDRRILDSVDGRIAVGWLVVEDLATVLVLVLLPALAVPLGGTPERAAALLCFGEGCSHGEAAEIMGLPLGTLKSIVARARAALVKILEA